MVPTVCGICSNIYRFTRPGSGYLQSEIRQYLLGKNFLNFFFVLNATFYYVIGTGNEAPCWQDIRRRQLFGQFDESHNQNCAEPYDGSTL